jgi:hypothetical protein
MPGGYEMADKVVPGPVEGSAAVREAVCIHTRKIFDSCREKPCARIEKTKKTAGRPICGFSAAFSSSKFGKIFILPNYLWNSSIDTAPYFWYAHIRN